MEKKQYTKHLAKNQDCAIFHVRDTQKLMMFYPNLQSFVWRRHVGVPSRGTNMAAVNKKDSSVFDFFL